MKNKLIVLVAVLLSATAFAQNSTGVAVNADGSDAHVSAMLDVQSTTLGFLTPRMTLADRDAIVSPADGLLIYQTNGDKGFYFYEATGQTWVPIGGNLSQWSLTGNSGTDPANNFIGTSDEKALVFKTNAEERMRITEQGLVGIGITNAGAIVDITAPNAASGQDAVTALRVIGGRGGYGDYPDGGGAGSDIILTGGQAGNSTGAPIGRAGDVIITGGRGGYRAMDSFRDGGKVILRGGPPHFDDIGDIYYGHVILADDGGKVGIGTYNPWNKLHIVAASNPLRLEGLQTSTQNEMLVVDANGVVSKRNVNTGSNWLLTGNAIFDPIDHFIGTTNNMPLAFRANNTEHIRLMPDGKVGIGTYAPAVLLDVNGQVKSQHDFYDATAELIVTDGWEATVKYAVRGANSGVIGALGYNEDGVILGAGVSGEAGTTAGHLAYFDENMNAAVFGKVQNSNDFSGFFEGGNVNIADGSLKLSNSDPGGAGLIGIQSDMTGTGNTIGIKSIAESQSAGNPAYGGHFSAIMSGDQTGTSYGMYATAAGSLGKNFAGYFDDGNVYIKNKLGLGTEVPSQQLELTGSIEMKASNSSEIGVIYKGGIPFLHNYGPEAEFAHNTFLGIDAGNFNMSGAGSGEGFNNTGIGALSLNSLYVGWGNTAVGVSALQNTVGGSDNTALGVAAGMSVSNGAGNTLIGYYAGGAITTGSNNIVIGKSATVPSAVGNDQLVIGNPDFFYGNMGTMRIGIGTANPQAALDVKHTLSDLGQQIAIKASFAQNSQTSIGVYSDIRNTPSPIDNIAIYGAASGASNFNWAGYFDDGDVYIKNRLGIGNIQPEYALDLEVEIDTDDIYGLRSVVKGIDHSAAIYSATAGRFEANMQNAWCTYAVYGTASGAVNNYAGYFDNGNVYIKNNLGIGTTSPQAKLHVNGSIRGQHQSSDGSAGISGTRTWTVQLNLEETATHNVVIKDGIIVSWTIDYLP